MADVPERRPRWSRRSGRALAGCGFWAVAAGTAVAVICARRCAHGEGKSAFAPSGRARLDSPFRRARRTLSLGSADDLALGYSVALRALDTKSMTVADLKGALKERGLPVGGLKADLVARLRDAEARPSPVAEGEDAEEAKEEAAEEEEAKEEKGKKVGKTIEAKEEVEEEEEEEEEKETRPQPPPLQQAEPERRANVQTEIIDSLAAAATSPAATRTIGFDLKSAVNIQKFLLRQIGPRGRRVQGGARDGPYSKELRLMEHVLDTAKAGHPTSACQAIEYYGEGVLGKTSQWLKVAAGGKMEILRAATRGGAPGRGVLEIGTYMGYSSMRMASYLPGVRVISLEVDPVHVVVARNVVAVCGQSARIDIWTGHSKDLLSRLPIRYGGNLTMACVFMDQKGSRYTEDLDGLEREGLTTVGSLVIADNVLKPGAPLFLWRTMKTGTYDSQLLTVGEFAMPSEDWMSVSCLKTLTIPRSNRSADNEGLPVDGQPWNSPGPAVEQPGPASPLEFPELEREADRMRSRARRPGRSVTFEEWADFAQHLKAKLGAHGVVVTAMAPKDVATEERLQKRLHRHR